MQDSTHQIRYLTSNHTLQWMQYVNLTSNSSKLSSFNASLFKTLHLLLFLTDPSLNLYSMLDSHITTLHLLTKDDVLSTFTSTHWHYQVTSHDRVNSQEVMCFQPVWILTRWNKQSKLHSAIWKWPFQITCFLQQNLQQFWQNCFSLNIISTNFCCQKWWQHVIFFTF